MKTSKENCLLFSVNLTNHLTANKKGTYANFFESFGGPERVRTVDFFQAGVSSEAETASLRTARRRVGGLRKE